MNDGKITIELDTTRSTRLTQEGRRSRVKYPKRHIGTGETHSGNQASGRDRQVQQTRFTCMSPELELT